MIDDDYEVVQMQILTNMGETHNMAQLSRAAKLAHQLHRHLSHLRYASLPNFPKSDNGMIAIPTNLSDQIEHDANLGFIAECYYLGAQCAVIERWAGPFGSTGDILNRLKEVEPVGALTKAFKDAAVLLVSVASAQNVEGMAGKTQMIAADTMSNVAVGMTDKAEEVIKEFPQLKGVHPNADTV
jgi:hypothetical protein